MKETLRVMIVPCMGEPYEKVLEADPSGSLLAALQDCVGGCIEPMPFVFDDEPSVYCNENGKLDPSCRPNRAIFVTQDMAAAGWASPSDPMRPAEVGELLDVAYGDLVCVGFDPETGCDRDISDKEMARIRDRFGGTASIMSGEVAAAAIKAASARRSPQAVADAARAAAVMGSKDAIEGKVSLSGPTP